MKYVSYSEVELKKSGALETGKLIYSARTIRNRHCNQIVLRDGESKLIINWRKVQDVHILKIGKHGLVKTK
jgi:hypothetical protein